MEYGTYKKYNGRELGLTELRDYLTDLQSGLRFYEALRASGKSLLEDIESVPRRIEPEISRVNGAIKHKLEGFVAEFDAMIAVDAAIDECDKKGVILPSQDNQSLRLTS